MLIIILIISSISLLFNAGYIIHELGWFPHTKDRRSKVYFNQVTTSDSSSKFSSHDYQVLDDWSYELRKLGHPDVYHFKDPYAALENVIKRYKEDPTRSRYDDLVHLPNYISNHILSDERVNSLIEQVAELMLTNPYKR